jgi:hypothetical protein
MTQKPFLINFQILFLSKVQPIFCHASFKCLDRSFFLNETENKFVSTTLILFPQRIEFVNLISNFFGLNLMKDQPKNWNNLIKFHWIELEI